MKKLKDALNSPAVQTFKHNMSYKKQKTAKKLKMKKLKAKRVLVELAYQSARQKGKEKVAIKCTEKLVRLEHKIKELRNNKN